MREGLINLPKYDNAGKPLDTVTEGLLSALTDAFGGVTAIDAQGSWKHDGKLYREPVTQLVVAYDPHSDRDNQTLRNLAVAAGTVTGQLAMYVRYASGEVEIIEIKQPIRFVA
jgi:hypothetical protein